MSKRVIITGGTKGIGLAIAHAFAKKGFNLAICSRNQQDQDRLKEEFKAQYPAVQVLTFLADMSRREEVASFAKYIRQHWDKVDVLVNNTGVFLPGDITKEAEGTLESQIQTNLYSAYYMTRDVLPMIPKHGHIFNIGSIAGFMAYPGGGSYTISKFALHGFSKVLREELKDQYIKVTTIMPGATWSDSWKGATHPYDRLMPAEDVAMAVVQAYQLGPSSVVEEIIIRPQLGDLP